MKRKIEEFIYDLKMFLTSSELDIKPTEQCRKTLIVTIILAILVANIQVFLNFFTLQFALTAIVIFIITAIFSVIAGIKFSKQQMEGYYTIEKVRIKDVDKLLGAIKTVYAVNEEGEDLDLEAEKGVVVKKNHRYEITYYENEEGVLTINHAKHLGRYRNRLELVDSEDLAELKKNKGSQSH